MANVFISYGDFKYFESLQRIRRLAKNTKRFDKIIIYTPEDLPEYIKASPLFAFQRGGGYWAWKPYIVMDALSKCQEGDVVCYADSGCTLNRNSQEWGTLFDKLKEHDAIFFQYREDVRYSGWDIICRNPDNNSVKIRHWMKPSAMQYFIEYFGNDDFCDFSKIWGGAFFVKHTHSLLNIIREWYNLTLFRPDLLMDPIGKETTNLPKDFNVHRHDQAVLTPLVFYFMKADNVLVLPETSESDKEHAAIAATRFIQKKLPLWQYLKYRVYNLIHGE